MPKRILGLLRGVKAGLTRSQMSGAPALGGYTGSKFVDLTVECMAAVAGADHQVDPEEVAMVHAVANAVLGENLPPATVRAICVRFKNPPESFWAELAEHRDVLSDRQKRMIVKSCYMIGEADGSTSPTERAVIDRIYAAIAPEKAYDEIIARLDAL